MSVVDNYNLFLGGGCFHDEGVFDGGVGKLLDFSGGGKDVDVDVAGLLDGGNYAAQDLVTFGNFSEHNLRNGGSRIAWLCLGCLSARSAGSDFVAFFSSGSFNWSLNWGWDWLD